MIDRKRRGDRLAATEVNELAGRLRAIERMSGGNGVKVRSVPGSGISLQGSVNVTAFKEAANETLAVNVGQFNVPAFSPVGIVGHFYEDGVRLRYKRALSIRLPLNEDKGKFTVTAEPIKAGCAGRVWVSGVFPVRFKQPGSPNVRMDVQEGSSYLVPAQDGSAQILFEEQASPNAIHIAVARFIGPASPPMATARAVDLAQPGSQGFDPNGLRVVDDVQLGTNDIALLSIGRYRVSSGAWTLMDFPSFVFASEGTQYGRMLFSNAGLAFYAPVRGAP